jgi:hypothetical protein
MRLADDVVTGVSIGRRGHVYAVDGRDRLVAHPDGAFLLKHADLSSYTELSRMRREIAKSIDGTAGMFAGRGLD